MKLKENEEICDVCKDRLAKHKCMGCHCALCSSCSSIFRIQMYTTDFEEEPKTPINRDRYSFNPSLYPNPYPNPLTEVKTMMSKTDWIVCADCRKAMNKKNAHEEIQKSEEITALVEKIRKTTLASKILVGLDDEEGKEKDSPILNNSYITRVQQSAMQAIQNKQNKRKVKKWWSRAFS